MISRQSGFSIIGVIILVVAVVAAFLIGQRVYYARKAVKSVQNYTQCIKAKGAQILQTSPEQCVLDGQVFINVINPPEQ